MTKISQILKNEDEFMKRIINGLISCTNNIYNYIILKYRHVTIGANSKINGRIYCVSNSKQGIIIKEGAFVGAHSIILKGVTIGERSVIGAGSVVTKDIPSDELWVENPVRFVEYYNFL